MVCCRYCVQGVTLVRFYSVTTSMSCSATSILFTVYAGCPSSHRLNFLYPVNLNKTDEWLTGNAIYINGHSMLKLKVTINKQDTDFRRIGCECDRV